MFVANLPPLPARPEPRLFGAVVKRPELISPDARGHRLGILELNAVGAGFVFVLRGSCFLVEMLHQIPPLRCGFG